MKQEVDLIQYLPGFLQGIREFQELSKAENPEFKLLYEDIGALLNNGFIHTADLQGIRRWEKLLGITAPEASMEGRRAVLLGKWNRTIPYTVARLYEYLDALADRGDYHIDVSIMDCWLKLVVEDLPFYTLRAMRSLVKAVLPANMLFILADRVQGVVAAPVGIQAALRMVGVFYPRHNTPPFYLDGSMMLDGAYCLNGYLSGEASDFYPAMLRVVAGAGWRRDGLGTAGVRQLFRPWVRVDVGDGAALGIWGAAHAKAQAAGRFFLYGGAGAGTRAASQLAVQGAADGYVGAGASTQAIAGAKAEVLQEGVIRMGGVGGICGVQADGALAVEKDLWRLDGSVMLDGSRILDAEVYAGGI